MHPRRQNHEGYDDRRGYRDGHYRDDYSPQYRDNYGPYREGPRGPSDYYTDYTYTYTYDGEDGYGDRYDDDYYYDDRAPYPARDYWTRSGYGTQPPETDPYDPRQAGRHQAKRGYGDRYPPRRPRDYEMRDKGASVDPRQLRQRGYRPRSPSPEGHTVERRIQAAPFRPPPDYHCPLSSTVHFQNFQGSLMRAFREAVGQINQLQRVPQRQETTYVVVPSKAQPAANPGYIMTNKQPGVVSLLPSQQPSPGLLSPVPQPFPFIVHATPQPSPMIASQAASRARSESQTSHRSTTGGSVAPSITIIPPPPGEPGHAQITNAIPNLKITPVASRAPTPAPSELVTPPAPPVMPAPRGSEYQEAVERAQAELNRAFQSGTKTPGDLVQIAADTFAAAYTPLHQAPQAPQAFTQVLQREVARSLSRPASAANRSGGAASSASVTVPLAISGDLNKIYTASFDQPQGGTGSTREKRYTWSEGN